MNADARIAALRRRLAEDGADAALVTSPSNLVYLTGFEGVIDPGIHAACVLTSDAARFYTDHRYVEAARAAAAGTAWDVVLQEDDLYVELCEQLHAEGVASLLVESSMPYGRFLFVSERFGGAVRAADQLVEEIRQVKDAEEVERIGAAAHLADASFEQVLELVRPGISEREIALELEFLMRRAGSEAMPFPPIVASGPNSARPHAIPGDRTLARGDLVVLDFGARVGGYCSDMTRTVCVGAASAEQRRLYAAVRAANEAGLAAVRAGAACVEVDAAARAVLVAEGLGDYFTHGVGHGVGLDVHELPTVGRKSSHTLRTGAVITIEPGVYVEGVGGVRIEDLVVVEDGGCRLLSHAPKELIEL